MEFNELIFYENGTIKGDGIDSIAKFSIVGKYDA